MHKKHTISYCASDLESMNISKVKRSKSKIKESKDETQLRTSKNISNNLDNEYLTLSKQLEQIKVSSSFLI
jgi:hypothetical protein